MQRTDSTPISLSQALTNARKILEKASDSPTLDAELLLAHCLDKNQTYLHTWPEKLLSDNQLNCFEQLIEKRKTDYPVAYLLGHKPFWTLDLIVTEDVLIPRPETELLVEAGYTPMQGVHSVTSNAAKALGLDDLVGTLEAGKEAEIIIVDGDPSQDINSLWNVDEVIFGGVIVDRGSFDSKTTVRQPPAY